MSGKLQGIAGADVSNRLMPQCAQQRWLKDRHCSMQAAQCWPATHMHAALVLVDMQSADLRLADHLQMFCNMLVHCHA